MITDEEISELPEEPQLAFVEFEKICRARVQEKEQEITEQQFGDADPYRLEYINKVLAAAREYEIDALKNWQVPKAEYHYISNSYRQFTTDVDHFTVQIRLRHAPRNRRNSVGLDGNTKTKIHHHIEQIKAVIEAAEIPDDKRDALYGKLNRFALEVDKARTDLQSATAVWIAICDGVGQGFTKLEPARRMIDSISVLLGRAKETEESMPALSGPLEKKKLEGPRKQLAPPPAKPSPSDLDDEIPF